MFSHRHLYEDRPATKGEVEKRSSADALMEDHSVHNVVGGAPAVPETELSTKSGQQTPEPAPMPPLGPTASQTRHAAAAVDGADEDDEEEDLLGFWNAVIWLGIITVFISVLSDAISASIEDAAGSMGMSKVFIAAILLPIVGNAAEHAGSVMFAVKGKLDLSLGIAIGSSTQIALCVLPLLVIIGWCGNYDLTMNFGAFEGGSLLMSVISVTFAIKDGNSNWLLGLTLISMYIVIAVGFWAHNNQDLDER
jgi:Ca2+/H+ antiporter